MSASLPAAGAAAPPTRIALAISRSTVARRLIYLWCSQYYIGHFLKDTLQLPRPPAGATPSQSRVPLATLRPERTVSLPAGEVVRLEKHYEHEYGMPSTHAMNSVSMPTYVLYLSLIEGGGRYTGSPTALVVLAVIWASSCIMSRFYLGVHSPADVIVGIGHGLTMLLLNIAYGDAIDAWVLGARHWIPMVMVIVVVATIAYPRPERPMWVPTPGDTVLIVACMAGITVAANARADAHAASALIRFSGPDFATAAGWGSLLLRLTIGYSILFVTRAVAKAACMAVIPRLLGPAYGPADDHSIQPHLDAQRWRAEQERLVAYRRAKGEVGSKTGGDGDRGAGGLPLPPAIDTAGTPRIGLPLSDPDRVITPGGPGLRGALPLRLGALGGDGTASEPSSVVPSSRAGDATSPAFPLPADSPATAAAAPSRLPSSTGIAQSAAVPPDRVLIPPGRRYAVELPTKIVTYSAVGINAVFLVPWLLQKLGLAHYGL